jgi:FixJ family two-component response regulator
MNSNSGRTSSVTETIAIIDDHPAVRSALLRLLSAMGYHAELYASSEAFLANIDRCKACCLIIDVDLGMTSGMDLVRHPAVIALRRVIIMHSARDHAALRAQAFALGCAAFLCKPYDASELLAALVKAIEPRPTPYE